MPVGIRVFMTVLMAGTAAMSQGQVPEAPAPNVPQATAAAAPSLEETVNKWDECDEYLSHSPCKVTVNLSDMPLPATDSRGVLMPHAHWDVQVKPFTHVRRTEPLGKAAVLLKQSSPFLTCSVAAVPAAPARDLTANIGSLLTAVAGIGAPASVAGPVTAEFAVGKPLNATRATPSGDPALDALLIRVQDLADQADMIEPATRTAYMTFRDSVKNNWKFTFPSDPDAQMAINKLTAAAQDVLTALRSFTEREEDLTKLEGDVAIYEKARPNWPPQLQANLTALKAHMQLIKAHLADFSDKQKTVQQVSDYLEGLTSKSSLTMQALPMAYFSAKSVTETVTCKDAVTTNQAFDNIIFTAYYETVPHLDVSIGAIGSLLGGRQVATLTAPFTAAQAAACAGITGCGPSTLLGYKTRSSYQFMPGAFVEWRAPPSTVSPSKYRS